MLHQYAIQLAEMKSAKFIEKSACTNKSKSIQENIPLGHKIVPVLIFMIFVSLIGSAFSVSENIPTGSEDATIQILMEREPTATPTTLPDIIEPVIQLSSPSKIISPAEPDLDFISYQYHSWDIPDEIAEGNGFWIEIDLTNQMLYAYRNNQLISGFKVSTGIKGSQTVTGTYKIFSKYPAISMSGPGYDLADVPYTAFFYKGYAIHGTYWHHNFGTPMSHGCVNMDTDNAAWIYANANVGTYVMIHY